MRLRRSVTALSVVATLAAFAAMPTPPAYADSTTNTYIVQLKHGVSADAVVPKLMGTSAKVVRKVFQGGIVKLNAAQAKALAANPNVASVHKDTVVTASATETGAPWDLDVLDSQTATLDQTYTSPNDGSGVTVYVVDSGILRTHTEFANATIASGINFVANIDPDTKCGAAQISAGASADLSVDPANTTDQAGHGTAVSSLIAGATVGASKGVTLVPVRVLNCDGSGSESSIIAAADWIAGNLTSTTRAVANLSFGVAISQLSVGDTSLEDAFQGLIDKGVTVVAAAGNDSADACTESPAHLGAAITVASVNQRDAESSFSNYGTCVDLYAPGESVYVASTKSIYTLGIGSGTSFSAPLVAAGAAQVLHDHPTWTPAQVAADLVARASDGIVTSARVPNVVPNKLLNVTGRFSGTDPTISGGAYAGETAQATLHWSPAPTSPAYQWYRAGVPISGAVFSTYLTTADDINQAITVAATGTSPGYVPVAGTSASVLPQFGRTMTAGTPTVSGTAAVSYTLTADPGTWDPANVALAYQWFRNGVAIQAATATTYLPVAADAGQTLTVKVTGSTDGYVTATVESAPTAVIQGATSPLAYGAFVKAAYQDFLGRQPTAAELAAQSSVLSSGALSKASYLSSLSRSDEWLTAIVTKMYRDTLNRDPDPNGLADWVSWLRSGRFTVAQAASLFYSSSEYFTVTAHGDTSTWVQLLYQKLLTRTADSAGLPFWIANAGTYGKDWVAYNFYQSQETRMRRVEVIYQTLLFREPDAVGWPFWTARVLSTGDLQLAWEVANSDEYWDKAHTRYPN